MATMNQPPPQPAGNGGPKPAQTTTKQPDGSAQLTEAEPILRQRSEPTQPYGTLTRVPLGLSDDVRAASIEVLNQVLSDCIILRDMYQKHHWQVSGPTFHQLHLLFEKHYNELNELVDHIAERVQILGGISVAMAHDVAERTKIERPPMQVWFLSQHLVDTPLVRAK